MAASIAPSRVAAPPRRRGARAGITGGARLVAPAAPCVSGVDVARSAAIDVISDTASSAEISIRW